jgi:hypothetical protein
MIEKEAILNSIRYTDPWPKTDSLAILFGIMHTLWGTVETKRNEL